MAYAFTQTWTAHDHPERPLVFGAWVCDCTVCASVLNLAPSGLEMVVKSEMGRKVVTVWDLIESPIADLLDDPSDYVREVFVAR